jgi:hypothetical protein
MDRDLIDVRQLVGQLFRDRGAVAPDRDLALPLFVVEGVDGCGKTTFSEALAGGGEGAAGPEVDLRLLRLGQRSEIAAGFRELYSRQIAIIVEAGQRFADIADFLLETAALDALLYRVRLRSARLGLRPRDRFLSDSWSYRRFCKFVLLAHFRVCDGDFRRSSGLIEELHATYHPTFVASGGVLLAASRSCALAGKAGRFSPWETISLRRGEPKGESERFLEMIEGTAALLSEACGALRWPALTRSDPLPASPADSDEYTRFAGMVRAWAS